MAALGLAVAVMTPVSANTLIECRACDTAERFYDDRGDALAWTGPANAPAFEQLLASVALAASHGLNAADYHLALLEGVDPTFADRAIDEVATDAYLTLAAHLLSGRLDPVTVEPDWTALRRGRDLAAYLQAALSQGAVTESLEALAPPQPGYQVLRQALSRYRAMAAEGGWPQVSSGPTMRQGDRGERVVQLRRRLQATGDLPADSDGLDVELFDADLTTAVRAFQTRASLDADGLIGSRTLAQLNITTEQRIDQIIVNLERWRWLPEDLGRRHIRVNIADFSLEARADGQVEQYHDVIVGRLYRRTPVFTGQMSYFVLNPWWETPPSLAVQDKLPMFRNDPGAVERLGFQVIDRAGNLVEPSSVNWAEVPSRDFPYRIRQAPGPLNALGEVKFMFPNRHNVYLHDTPTRGLFSQNRRDFSSGCVRVRDPLALAHWVAAETPDWPASRIDGVAAGNVETRVALSRSIPVHILYWTVIFDAATGIRFVDDLYGRDGVVLAALEATPPPLE